MPARIFADSFYVNGVPIPASYFTALDAGQVAAIDGDAGGTWAPAAPLGIGGAGMWCAGPWYLEPPATQTSVHFARNLLTFENVNSLTHGDSDFIELATGQAMNTRTLNTPMSLGKDASGCQIVDAAGDAVGGYAVMLPNPELTGGVINTNSAFAYRRGGRLLVPLRVHNGATLATVTFWFTTATHTGVPTSLPLFRVHQIDVYGNITALGSGTVGDGFEVFHPTPNLAQWNNGGNPQSYTLTCVPNVIIDTSQFFYFAEIIDEAGNNAVAGNIWLECVASFTGIADMRPQ